MATVADDALNAQAVNRMLGAGADVAQAFQQEILRMNNGFGELSVRSANVHQSTTQLLTYNGAMALLGNNLELQAAILNNRSVGGQPQSGGGPGQPTSFPVQQALPNQPAVYLANATTGTLTKA